MRVPFNVFLKRLMLGVCLAVFLVYVLWQSRLLLTGPQIILTEAPFIEPGSVTITGTARNATTLSLNGRPITVSPEGTFFEVVRIPPGYTIIELVATDRYDRETRHQYDVINPAAAANE